MSRERDDRFDPTQPTLIVKSGNTQRIYRRLEKDVMVLGRAAGCDLGLEAPDVAPVHCVLVRAADCWRVRDCTGRGGTRLNGQSIQDESVADEDVLQIGSFSFAFHLPPEDRRTRGFGGRTTDAAVRRLLRSRRNFARLALRLRGRLRKSAEEVAERVEEQLAGRQEELDRQAEELDALQSDLDARLGEMRQTRQAVAVETRALLERHERVEKELAERQARADAAAAASPAEEVVGDAPRDVEIRARELGHYAAHLRRIGQRLRDHEGSLAIRGQEWLCQQQEASEQMAREEALLRDRRSEIVRLMGEMRQLRSMPRLPGPETEALRQENEQLQRTIAERDQALAAARAEAQRRAAEAEELRARLEAAAVESQEQRGEAVLDHFQFELEVDRQSLDEQILGIQGRYSELERAAREAEARMAGERVRITKELEALQLLRGRLRPAEGRSPTQETVADMPSPLHVFAEAVRNPEPAAAPGESFLNG